MLLIARRLILVKDYQVLLDELRSIFEQAGILKDKVH